MMLNLNAAIVRIQSKNDRVVGVGFLIGQREVLTCARASATACSTVGNAKIRC